MTFCIRDIIQIQTTTPAEVNRLNTKAAFIRISIENGKLRNVYMKIILLTVDLIF